ncbi:Amine oxidase [flavin-containing] A [Liparis tanakae]|uniref:Amine oxidase n=1 Tax=Liparis tanakae TaxID=230148 RepID=A0A4Z2GTN7_9TELE|nr:Amine oxidase [flavin-containing] A [Liparis tanakae]
MTAGFEQPKIHYQPALPSQREFLTQNMPVGHLIKFIITYQTAFWKEKGFSGEIVAGSSTGCPFCVTFDATSPSGNAALVGFIAGQQASQWSSKEGGERRKAVLSSLVQYLGLEAASFIHYEEKDWAKEDYSGGCPVNVMAPGMLTYYHPSLRKPCGRIHWAGTETATLWCGYMSGAVQAGQRAALEVLADLCPATLTPEEQEAARQTAEGGVEQTPASKVTRPSAARALVVAALAVGGVLLLAHHQGALLKRAIKEGRGLGATRAPVNPQNHRQTVQMGERWMNKSHDDNVTEKAIKSPSLDHTVDGEGVFSLECVSNTHPSQDAVPLATTAGCLSLLSSAGAGSTACSLWVHDSRSRLDPDRHL